MSMSLLCVPETVTTLLIGYNPAQNKKVKTNKQKKTKQKNDTPLFMFKPHSERASVYGVSQSRTRLKRLSSSSSSCPLQVGISGPRVGSRLCEQELCGPMYPEHGQERGLWAPAGPSPWGCWETCMGASRAGGREETCTA